MNDTQLHIYLHDHLALLVGETQLAARCRDNNRLAPLGEFLDQLHAELQAQRSIVRDVLRRVGGKENPLKNSVAWFAEKLGRFKLNGSLLTYSALSRLVELEALTAAATERINLWDNLETLAHQDERIKDLTYSFFRDQSEAHLQELHKRRRYAASLAFSRP